MSEEPKITFNNIMVGVLTTLIGTGVIGLWTLSVSVSRLDEQVALWTAIYEKRFERLDQEFQDIRKRMLRHPAGPNE